MKRLALSAAAVAVVLFTTVANAAAAYSELVVFGDSLSDAGNTHIRTGYLYPGAGYAGTFSNGPLWPSYAAPMIGVAPPSPSVLGGTNYAAGIATTSGGSAAIPSLDMQVDQYFANSGGGADAAALFAVWAGANNLFVSPTTAAADAATTDIATQVARLAGHGATHVLVFNLPDIGKTPDYTGDPTISAGATMLAQYFNAVLAAKLDAVQVGAPSLTLSRFDAFAFTDEAVANPAAWGFTDATHRALVSSSPVTIAAGSERFVFWDGVHPTTYTQSVLASRVVAAIPEPALGAAVSVFALGLLGGRRRGRVTSV